MSKQLESCEPRERISSRSSQWTLLALALCSCARSAPTSPSGPALVSEAGFLDVPPQTSAAQYPARMFYSFRPADENAPQKPLLVIFDGGPGGATTANLLAYGTGPVTLDPDAGTPLANLKSFTRFANLLFLDERQTGFSYGIGAPPAGAAPCTFSVVDDAVDYIRATFSFVEAHPGLMGAEVVLVGESYGGTRSTAILHLAESASDQTVAMPADVRQLLVIHGSQLGQAVLIQPFLAAPQHTAQSAIVGDDPFLSVDAGVCTLDGGGGGRDLYNVTKPCGWTKGLEAHAGIALAGADSGAALLGIDLGTVTTLLPAARTNAFRIAGASVDPAEDTFIGRFGALGPNDSYWTALNPTCPGYDPYLDPEPQTWLYSVFAKARLFITNARYDPIVYSPAIPWMLTNIGNTPATIDMTPQAGVARPGSIHVTFPNEAGTQQTTIRFPSYEASGHQVAVTQGADLADDVEAWLAEGPSR